MKNYVSRAEAVEITAGGTILSGEVVIVGSMIGVAAGDIASGAQGVINLVGAYDLPKVGSQAWTVGAAIYWDAGNDECTTAAEDNSLLGVALSAVGSGAGETTGRVRLNGAFGAPVIDGSQINTLAWLNETNETVLAGAGVVVGTIFGVAAADIEDDATGILKLTGTYDLPKAGTQAWTVGAAVYWDAGNDECTTVAEDNPLIGCAVLAVGAGAEETTGRVRLNGIAGLGAAVDVTDEV